jgi:hypothetical protein
VLDQMPPPRRALQRSAAARSRGRAAADARYRWQQRSHYATSPDTWATTACGLGAGIADAVAPAILLPCLMPERGPSIESRQPECRQVTGPPVSENRERNVAKWLVLRRGRHREDQASDPREAQHGDGLLDGGRVADSERQESPAGGAELSTHSPCVEHGERPSPVISAARRASACRQSARGTQTPSVAIITIWR